MQQNNIQPKWGENKKIYSEHFDNMIFDCKPGYQISDPKLLRIQCLDGVLKYPRCLKEGKHQKLQKMLLFPPTILPLNLCTLFNKQGKNKYINNNNTFASMSIRYTAIQFCTSVV